MDGRLRRLALIPLLVLGGVAAGCGGDDEGQTTLDLTGLVNVENLSDEIPVSEEALEAAIVRNIKERAPDDVKVVYRAGDDVGTGPVVQRPDESEGTEETPGGPGNANVDICPFLPYLCTHTDLSDIVAESANEAAEVDANSPIDIELENEDPIPAEPVEVDANSPIELENNDPIPAEVFQVVGEVTIGRIEAQVVYDPDTGGVGTLIQNIEELGETGEGDEVGEGTTTATTTTATTEVEPAEPVDPGGVEPEPDAVEPAEPAPAPTEP